MSGLVRRLKEAFRPVPPPLTVTGVGGQGDEIERMSVAQLPPLTGPECRESMRQAVLKALERNGTATTPGQKIQYLQVAQNPDTGAYYVQPCVVTVPMPIG